MKLKLFQDVIILLFFVSYTSCKRENFQEQKKEVFGVNSFISNIKCYNVTAAFNDSSLPVDTSAPVKPFVSAQSWVVKGNDMLVSVTVPENATEIYFGAANPKDDYAGLHFEGEKQDIASGNYCLQLAGINNPDPVVNGFRNYLLVLSTNEITQVNRFELFTSYKTSSGVSNKSITPIDAVSVAPYQKKLRVGFRPLLEHSYTLSINSPDGSIVTHSYNKNTGNATSSTTINHDSQLNINWVDLNPVFGTYNIKDILAIDIPRGGGVIYIELLFIIYAEGKIDQVVPTANVFYGGGSTATGNVNISFSHFPQYQFSVNIDPILTDGWARIPRSVEKTVNITTKPNPLPPNESISLELKTKPGTFGAAVFLDNGRETQSMQINGSRNVTIKGKQHSNVTDNISLVASYKGSPLASQNFSVRTHFSKLTVTSYYNSPLEGEIHENYIWQSESGDLKDLIGLTIGERVIYKNGTSTSIIWPSPPYSLSPSGDPVRWQNPIIKSWVIDNTNYNIGGNDYHYIPGSPLDPANNKVFDPQKAFTSKKVFSKIEGSQTYWFRDPVLMDPNFESILSGPSTIIRTVSEFPAGWKYQIQKDQEPRAELLLK